MRSVLWEDLLHRRGSEPSYDCTVADRNTIERKAIVIRELPKGVVGRGCTIGAGAVVNANLKLVARQVGHLGIDRLDVAADLRSEVAGVALRIRVGITERLQTSSSRRSSRSSSVRRSARTSSRANR